MRSAMFTGKEPMIIGGPWSESEDGRNPDKDPQVLIRTAIRTMRQMTGVDLSKCTRWLVAPPPRPRPPPPPPPATTTDR